MNIEVYDLGSIGNLEVRSISDEDQIEFQAFPSLNNLPAKDLPTTLWGLSVLAKEPSIAVYSTTDQDAVVKAIVVRETLLGGALIFVFAYSFLALDDYLVKIGGSYV